MAKEPDPLPERPPVGTLIDFVYGVDENSPLDIEVAVKEDGRVVVFHNKPFKNDVSWLEFDLGTNELDFVLDDGAIRDAGIPLKQTIAKHMQNSHQILMILMDDNTGEAKEAKYIPLIIHQG